MPGPDVRALFDEALALGRRLMAPRAVVRWAPVTRRSADAIEAGDVALAIPGVGAPWGPVEWVAVAVCTIGEALERRVAELWEARELPLASMLDSVGSGAVESLAEYVNDLLCQEAIPARAAGHEPHEPRLRRAGTWPSSDGCSACARATRSASA